MDFFLGLWLVIFFNPAPFGRNGLHRFRVWFEIDRIGLYKKKLKDKDHDKFSSINYLILYFFK